MSGRGSLQLGGLGCRNAALLKDFVGDIWLASGRLEEGSTFNHKRAASVVDVSGDRFVSSGQ